MRGKYLKNKQSERPGKTDRRADEGNEVPKRFREKDIRKKAERKRKVARMPEISTCSLTDREAGQCFVICIVE